MPSRLTYLVAAVIGAHGLVHLLGTAVYLEVAEFAELPYETTLLGGHVDVGEAGIRLFGILCAVAAAGFVTSAVALVRAWRRWRTLLVAVTIFSLVLTTLDWTVASAGVVVNFAILTGLVIESRL